MNCVSLSGYAPDAAALDKMGSKAVWFKSEQGTSERDAI